MAGCLAQDSIPGLHFDKRLTAGGVSIRAAPCKPAARLINRFEFSLRVLALPWGERGPRGRIALIEVLKSGHADELSGTTASILAGARGLILSSTCFESGAPEGNNLEPFLARGLLEELEGWAEVLKGEPEVIHRLAAFAEAAAEEPDQCVNGLAAVPSIDEPSP